MIKATICLNMIVKDEESNILICLNNVCKYISLDYWVISDTGSTDKTKEIIIDFFKTRNIPGELIEKEWVDFGYNRTVALQKAYNKTDYLYVLDADDILIGDFQLPSNIFEYDSYLMKFGQNNIFYRKQLINNRKRWRYLGVLHEYIECLEEDRSSTILGNYSIVPGTHGNRSSNEFKYQKDALLLEKAYEKAIQSGDPLHARYSYYCANSYRDAEDADNAIRWYKNTLTLNNWIQEKYCSCLQLCYLYKSKNEIENMIYYCIQSMKYDKTRVECIYKLIEYYCGNEHSEIAYIFYKVIQPYYENEYLSDTFHNKLFVDISIYSFYLPYFMIIVSDKVNKREIGLKMYDILFTKKYMNVGEWWIKNIVYNLQFFIYHNQSIEFVEKWNHYLSLINEKNYNIDRNLVNKYEIYNIAHFLQKVDPPLKEEMDDKNDIVVAILSKNSEITLPFYLKCIYNQTYDKKYIHLYIRTNDNTDKTRDILFEYINNYGDLYASVYFDDTDTKMNAELIKLKNHHWNQMRFQTLSKIRQESIDYAIQKKADYFTVDCDNFIIPSTLENLMKIKKIGIVSPMLKEYPEWTNYSNFHYKVAEDGFYEENETYRSIVKDEITGIIRSGCVHCTYYIDNRYLPLVSYIDGTERYEYVIFSEIMRKHGIGQYIDNTEKYGFLVRIDNQEQFDKHLQYWENKYNFKEYP